METIQTHPANALQARAFTAPGSLSFPGGHIELTPPHEPGNAAAESQQSAGSGKSTDDLFEESPGGGVVTPVTPAATPVAMTSGSGLVPTLQYVLQPVFLVAVVQWCLSCFHRI